MPKKTTHRHIIFIMQTIRGKENILKEARGKKQLTNRGAKIRVIYVFAETT